jgi:glycosidase
MLSLPGSAYLYQGEELGLEEVEVPVELRKDPVFFRTGEPGRDGCRIPLPWDSARKHAGFSTGLDQGAADESAAVDATSGRSSGLHYCSQRTGAKLATTAWSPCGGSRNERRPGPA